MASCLLASSLPGPGIGLAPSVDGKLSTGLRVESPEMHNYRQGLRPETARAQQSIFEALRTSHSPLHRCLEAAQNHSHWSSKLTKSGKIKSQSARGTFPR